MNEVFSHLVFAGANAEALAPVHTVSTMIAQTKLHVNHWFGDWQGNTYHEDADCFA